MLKENAKDYLNSERLRKANMDILDLTDIIYEKSESKSGGRDVDDPTLKEMVMGILRPEIEGWLKKNLAGIVKEEVKREIRKIVPDHD